MAIGLSREDRDLQIEILERSIGTLTKLRDMYEENALPIGLQSESAALIQRNLEAEIDKLGKLLGD